MTTSTPDIGLLFLSKAAKIPKGAEEYDIVAVHGLNGDRVKSWTHIDPETKKETVWLRDLLPSRVPAAWIMSFGWTFDDDSATEGSITAKGVKTKALELLNAICNVKTASEEAKSRPLLLLGQDIGGTIIKQALLIAKYNDLYRSVTSNVFRLLFFGTPHRATHLRDWEILAFKIIFTSSMLPTSSETLTTVIETSARTLMDVSEEFLTIAGKHDVVSFYEAKDSMPFLGLVIDVYSAGLDVPSEDVVTLLGNHETMRHFSLQDSEELNLVCEKMKYTRGPNVKYIDCLKTLLRLSSGASPTLPSQWHPSTLTWVLSHEEYLKWLQGNEARFLIVQGKSGSGKSVLVSFLLKALRSSPGREKALVHFSFIAGDVRRSSVRGMLASLIGQLLSHQPDLFRYVQSDYEEWVVHHSPWTGEVLWMLFRSIVVSLGHSGIICIIDGADECDSTLPQFLDGVMALADVTAPSRFKIIIAGRTLPTPRNPCVINLDEQPENQSDIKRVVQSILSDLVHKRPAFEDFKEQIQNVACEPNTTFLRATLSVDYLRYVSLKSTPFSIRKILKPFGSSLYEIYDHILQYIPLELSLWAWEVLLWVLYAFRPLKTHELAIALAIQADSTSYTSINDHISRDIGSDLHRTFGCLIRIERDEVHLVHPSAREYLLTRTAKNNMETLSKQPHGVLARRCLTYLFMRELSDDPPTIDYSSGEPECFVPRTQKYGLLAYAVEYWPEHYRLANKSPVFSRRVINFLEHKTQVRMWSELYWCLANSTPRPDRILVDPLYVAAELGLTDVVELLLNARVGSDILVNNGGDSLALEVAAEHGHADVVERLLTSGVSDKSGISRGLFLAARNGALGIVKQLVGLDDALAYVDSMQSTPLHTACRNGHLRVVKVLLREMHHAELDCNPIDHKKSTPLHLAAQNGGVAVVHELLNAGANVKATNDTEMTPLHSAALRGHPAVVGVLLQAEADVSMIMTNRFTPLHLAAQEGHSAVVEQLVKAGADPSAVEYTKRTPLHLAAASGHVEVVMQLNRNGADTEAVAIYGSVPLHFAASNGHVAVVKELIHATASVDVTDDSQKTPLCYAAINGHLTVVKELVRAGASVDATDKSQNTPLHLAALNGHVAVVEELVRAGASVDATDKSQNTPLHLAALSGHVAVVEELVRAGASVDATENLQNTPLCLAAKLGQEAVVEALLEAKANIATADKNESSPLHLAAERGFVKVVRTLVNAKASVKAKNFDEFTPLHLAARCGHPDVLKELLKAGAIPNVVGINENTPLHSAALGGMRISYGYYWSRPKSM